MGPTPNPCWANYGQHISFAAALGCFYAWVTFVFAGVHVILYGLSRHCSPR